MQERPYEERGEDDGLSSYLLAQLDDLTGQMPQRTLVTSVRGAIADSLPDGQPSRSQIARRVGMSEAGQRVLVIGASGGVGNYAVQLAKTLGAGHVTAVAGTANLDLVRSIGADEVIDHRREPIDARGTNYDLVIDIGGRNPIRRLRRVLTDDGTLVIVGGEGGNRITGGFGRQIRALLLSPFVRQRLTTFISREHHGSMDALAALMADGSVKPVIGGRWRLGQVPDALRALEAGTTNGKSVVVVRPTDAPS